MEDEHAALEISGATECETQSELPVFLSVGYGQMKRRIFERPFGGGR
jgi:hypothetical protein